jgi:hypothetical protein
MSNYTAPRDPTRDPYRSLFAFQREYDLRARVVVWRFFLRGLCGEVLIPLSLLQDREGRKEAAAQLRQGLNDVRRKRDRLLDMLTHIVMCRSDGRVGFTMDTDTVCRTCRVALMTRTEAIREARALREGTGQPWSACRIDRVPKRDRPDLGER